MGDPFQENSKRPSRNRSSRGARRLTERWIERLEYHGRIGTAHYVWDDRLQGFGVRVYPSGLKSYLVSYRAKGRQRFYTLGRFGELRLQEARGMAMEVLARVRQGGDPSAERQAEMRAPTIADLCRRYLSEHAEVRKKASSVQADEANWRLHVLPALGRRKVVDIERRDILGLHTSMASKPYAANRTLSMLSKAFNLAELWGWRLDRSNPCRHVERYKEQRRERYLSTDELARLAEVLAKADRTRGTRPAPIAAIRLLVFTGCRVGEILKLRWSEVDLPARCLRLADSKSGSKVVHLNSAAVELLAELDRRRDDHPYVVPGLKPGAPLRNLHPTWKRIRKAAGLEDVRLHDLRHSYASFAAGLGLSLPMIGRMLGHTQSATTERYAHLAVDPLRQATERVGAEISAAMSSGAAASVTRLQNWRARL